MKNLIDKYLDGELTEEEAATFLEAVARDPEMEAELRTYEEMLSLSVCDPSDGPSTGFTDAVMNRISAGAGRPAVQATQTRKPVRWRLIRAWRFGLAWASVLGLAFAVGRMTAGPGLEPGAGSEVTSVSEPGPRGDLQLAGASFQGQRPRLVRLIYIPSDPDVARVTIAGTFNRWNPEGITMERTGDVWTAQLVLPPGTYEYMFVENGENWVTDPLALQTRDDGFGRKNAVLDVSI